MPSSDEMRYLVVKDPIIFLGLQLWFGDTGSGTNIFSSYFHCFYCSVMLTIAEPESQLKSVSTKMPHRPPAGWQPRLGSHVSMDESDLWLAFLTEAGYLFNSDTDAFKSESVEVYRSAKLEDDIIRQINNSQYTTNPHMALGLRDPYEHIHRYWPGLFWDTVTTDDPEKAFINVRRIIRNIVNSQKKLKPMFDIDFTHLSDYPTVEKKLDKIRKQIAPQQLFY